MHILLFILLILSNNAYADSKASAFTTDTSPAITDKLLAIKDPSGTPLNRLVGINTLFKSANITVTGTNVGVGSVNPGQILDVTGTVRATAFSGDGSALTGVGAGFTDDGTIVRLTTVTDNVGIGTTLPAGNLGVKGTLVLPGMSSLQFSDSNYAKMIYDTTATYPSLQMGLVLNDNNASGVMSIMELADLGNANRAPTAKVTRPQLRIYGVDTTKPLAYGNFIHNDFDFYIQTGGGRVYISPAARLDGTDHTGVEFNSPGSGTNLRVGFNYGGVAGMSLNHEGSTAQNVMGLSSTGGRQIVIGDDAGIAATGAKDFDHAAQTNPTVYIHSVTDPDTSNNEWGSLTHNQAGFLLSSGSSVGVGTTATTIDNYIAFAPRGTERVRIDGAGNVGISSTAPGAALDVQGTVRATNLNIGIGTTSPTRVCVTSSGWSTCP